MDIEETVDEYRSNLKLNEDSCRKLRYILRKII